MKSLNAQIKQIAAMRNTDALTSWESDFISSIMTKTLNAFDTSELSDAQVEVLEKIYHKHFGD